MKIRSVLIAHPHPDVRTAVERVLHEAGCSRIVCVSEAVTANALLEAVDFDLLVLGVYFPEPERITNQLLLWTDIAAAVRGGLRRSTELPICLICDARETNRERRPARAMRVELLPIAGLTRSDFDPEPLFCDPPDAPA